MLGNATGLEVVRALVAYLAFFYCWSAFRRNLRWWRNRARLMDPNAGDFLVINVRLDGLVTMIATLQLVGVTTSLFLPPPVGLHPNAPILILTGGINLYISAAILVVKILNRVSLARVEERIEARIAEAEAGAGAAAAQEGDA